MSLSASVCVSVCCVDIPVDVLENTTGNNQPQVNWFTYPNPFLKELILYIVALEGKGEGRKELSQIK